MSADYINMMARFNHEPQEIPDYVLADFRRLFIQDDTRFDADEFIDYVKAHPYTQDYAAHKRGFINKKVSEERLDYQAEKRREAEERSRKAREENEAIRAEVAAEAEAKMKERARRAYPFSDAAFEKDWDNHLRARYAARQMNTPPANPRDYQHDVPGGHSEPINR